MKQTVNSLIILCALTLADSTAPAQDISSLSGAYFGIKPPTNQSVVFLDGIISLKNEDEMCGAFLPGGKTFLYNNLHKGSWTIFITKEMSGAWQKPEPISFTSGYTDRDFTLSPDGKSIFFGSDRPSAKGEKALDNLDIFRSDLVNEKWTMPVNIGLQINTSRSENYPSVSSNGNLYFFSNRPGGIGGCDIYVSELRDGKYKTATNAGKRINSIKHDWDSFIAPDESYIIFSSQNRDDTIGRQDLYISFKMTDGSWTKSINMGPRVNSIADEICPSVSDGIMFFTTRRRGMKDIFWIDASIIDELR